MIQPYFENKKFNLKLFNNDSFELLEELNNQKIKFDCIFVDPPYFLSNDGITCHSGKMVKVNKGDWDRSRGVDLNYEFNFDWLERCKNLLTDNGTIWISGTFHIIYAIAFAAQKLLESTVLEMLEYWINKTGVKNLCISGGVGLNVKMNGRIWSSNKVDDIFIYPICSDAGSSIGSAMALRYQMHGMSNVKIDSVFLGPEYSNDEIYRVLTTCKIDFIKQKPFTTHSMCLFNLKKESSSTFIKNFSFSGKTSYFLLATA